MRKYNIIIGIGIVLFLVALFMNIRSPADTLHSRIRPIILVVSQPIGGKYVVKAAYLPTSRCITRVGSYLLKMPHLIVEEPYAGWKPCSPL